LSGAYIPSRGERVEQTRCGVRRVGTVWYSDQLQLLIKWDEGSSSSLTLANAALRVLTSATNSRKPAETAEASAA
jgi:hypothetical protein